MSGNLWACVRQGESREFASPTTWAAATGSHHDPILEADPLEKDPRLEEVAEEILHDLFEPEREKASRQAPRPQHAAPESELAGGQQLFEDPFLQARAKAEEKTRPRKDYSGLESGTTTLPREAYAEYGIAELPEDLAKRKTIANDYYASEAGASASDAADDWYIDPSYTPSEESFTPRWMQNVEVAVRRRLGLEEESVTDAEDGPLRLKEVVECLREEKGDNLVVIDMRDKCDYTDWMVICEGRSKKQLYALVDSVRRRAKRRIPYDSGLPPTTTIEGADTDDWMLIDLGRFIVHAFTPEARLQYNLEGLWTAIRDPLLTLAREAAEDDVASETESQLNQFGKMYGERITNVRPKDVQVQDWEEARAVVERSVA
ncbi:Oligomerization domain-containing protein [Gaertneriomyces semiglobifer]|nr:Oligomerization domain-containing protein [Gaertneriomyces semiglobifer]